MRCCIRDLDCYFSNNCLVLSLCVSVPPSVRPSVSLSVYLYLPFLGFCISYENCLTYASFVSFSRWLARHSTRLRNNMIRNTLRRSTLYWIILVQATDGHSVTHSRASWFGYKNSRRKTTRNRCVVGSNISC